MQKLLDHLKGSSSDVFTSTTEDQVALVKEYYERSRRKNEDEKWLKKHRPTIIEILQKHGRDKMDFGNIRVSLTVPNTSHFDQEKLAEYLLKNGLNYLIKTKYEVDEEALTTAIEHGAVNLEEIKAHAWVESKGAPRLEVKVVG